MYLDGYASLNYVKVPFNHFGDVIVRYENNHFFRPIVKALCGELPTEIRHERVLEKLICLRKIYNKMLLFTWKLFVPRKLISTVMHMAYDFKISFI